MNHPIRFILAIVGLLVFCLPFAIDAVKGHGIAIGPRSVAVLGVGYLIVLGSLAFGQLNRRICLNMVLVHFSLIVSFCLVEIGVFRYGLRFLPSDHQEFLPDFVGPLVSGNYVGFKPSCYTLLVGDSHAQGAGDMALTPSSKESQGIGTYFGAFIHHNLGVDVVSFGHPGAGSMDGFFLHPIAVKNKLDNLSFYSLDEPKLVIALFYEGNDFYNNINFIERHLQQSGSASRLENLEKQVLNTLLQQYEDHFLDELVKPIPLTRVYVVRTLSNIHQSLVNLLQGKPHTEKIDSNDPSSRSSVTKFLVNNDGIDIYQALQGPPLELSDYEIRSAASLTATALTELQRRYSNATILAYYLPSVLGAHHISSKKVLLQSYRGNKTVYTKQQMDLSSDFAYRALDTALSNINIPLVDLRGPFRLAGRKQLLVGPIDWKHFNRGGQQILSREIGNDVQVAYREFKTANPECSD